MMYPYLTFSDETEVCHSQIIYKNDHPTIEVHFERPTDNGFDTVRFSLPSYEIIQQSGHFSEEEINNFKEFLHNNAHLLFEFAETGGIFCA